MTMLQQMTWRGPTEAEMDVVKDTYKKTGILTVKDAATGHKSAHPYGTEYQPHQSVDMKCATQNGPSTSGFASDTVHVRSMQVECVGSARLPNGIAVGGAEVWVRDVMAAHGGTSFSVVKFLRDISQGEFDRLLAWANDTPWVTNKVIAAEEKRSVQIRRHQLESQQDPVGVMARTVADALKGAPAAAPAAPAGLPTPEQLRAAGFVQDGAGNWHLLSKTKESVKS